MRKKGNWRRLENQTILSLPLVQEPLLTLGVSNRPSLPLSSPTPSMSVATAEHIRARASGEGWSSGGGSIGEEEEEEEEKARGAAATPLSSSSDDSEEDAAEEPSAVVSKTIFGAWIGFEVPSAACRGAEAEEPILREESRETETQKREGDQKKGKRERGPASLVKSSKNFLLLSLSFFSLIAAHSIDFSSSLLPRFFLATPKKTLSSQP